MMTTHMWVCVVESNKKKIISVKINLSSEMIHSYDSRINGLSPSFIYSVVEYCINVFKYVDTMLV
jgi:hypothetical protein